jgi:hypothetical protein
MNPFSLRRFLKNKRALGTPIGNLIVIVAAVLLCTTVCVFAVNITTAQAQKEKLYIPSTHVWYIDPDVSIAALAITNTGAVDVVLNKIDVKGLQCEWNGTNNYVIYCRINGTLPGDLPAITTSDISGTGTATINIAGSPYDFEMANQGLTIKVGTSLAFYVVVPNRVMIYDLATPLRMMVSTTQAVYITETLVSSL